jgi:hypothetical protein
MAAGDWDRVPDVAGIRDDVRSDLVTFVRALRRAGVDVPANAAVVAGRALVTMGFDDEARARAALRAALVRRHQDIDTFDRMFGEFWRRLRAHLSLDGEGESGLVEDDDARPDGQLAPIGAEDAPEVEGDEGGGESGETGLEPEETWSGSVAPGDVEDGDDDAVATATYSPAGQPERVTVTLGPFADEGGLSRSVEGLARALATERGRRWQPAAGGERADVRRSLRKSVSAGGAIVSVPERERAATANRTLVLADVSRSVLDVIDRSFLVRWLRALSRASRNCRLFLFDDDVVEVTRAFASGSTRDAVRTLRDAETAWGGGTRIGNAVTTVRDDYPDAVDRRTTVLIVSDGLEMGDVSSLETGMAWLSRRAAAVLWLNPLAAAPDYEPVADGMAAALPSVDGLFAFTGPDDVAELTRQLTLYGTGGAVGYEHDPRRVRGNGAKS